MEVTVNDWLEAVHHEVELRRWRDESEGQWKSFTVHNKLPAVSPVMLDWYLTNFDSDSYRLWHPAHVGLQWEKKILGPGATHIAWERINGRLAAYRIVYEEAEKAVAVAKSAETAKAMNVLDSERAVLLSILMEPGPGGITGTFSFPVATPDGFVEAHLKHAEEEVYGMANVAAPYLVRKVFGWMATDDVLLAHPLIVAAEGARLEA
jgi:hypothetical protein